MIQILSHATVFVCPSVYEPLGIVNLEAMACEAAVVATAVGGIPEVVEDGVTGLLVPFEASTEAGPAHRSTRPASRPTSPRASTSCSPTRPVPRGFVVRAPRPPAKEPWWAGVAGEAAPPTTRV